MSARTTPPMTPAEAFAADAEALADWTLANLVVRHDVHGRYRPDGGQYTAHEALTRDLLIRHFRGEITVGLHSTSADGRCKSVALDVDAHDEKADPDANWRCVLRAVELFAEMGLTALVFDSNGKGGYHVRAFFKKPIAVAAAHWLGEWVRAILAAEGFALCEAFPKQRAITLDCPFGNWLRIFGRHHKRDHWTRIWDPVRQVWLEGRAAVRRILKITGDKTDKLLVTYNAGNEDEAPADDNRSSRGHRQSASGNGKHTQDGTPCEDEIRSALNALPSSMAEDYDPWLAVGMALHDWDSVRGLALWREFSARCPSKYIAAACDEKWSTFASVAGGVTIKTIFFEAHTNGWLGWRRPEANKAGAKRESARPTEDHSDEDAIPVPPRAWPEPPEDEVYCGLAGEIVREMEPHTEADPFGMAVQLLIMFGSAAGRAPHYSVEDTRHGCNENAILVGDSAVGRKGTATDRIVAALEMVDSSWAKHRIRGGLSSGEGLISAVRDPQWAKMPVKDKGRIVDYQDVMVDGGVDDKRLLVVESEFGGALRALGREGNKLSALLRQAWDNGNLASLTKNPLKATDAHISIIGHITADELLAHLSGIDLVNGLSNRFLWIAVRRSKVLPFGGRPKGLPPLVERLEKALVFARGIGRMDMDLDARSLWESSYPGLTTPPPGKLGAVTSRGAPHTVRLAMLYALMDQSESISADHLEAALALWRASARCAAFIFGDSLGNPDADKILRALRAEANGLTRAQIREGVFQRNAKAERITAALGYLLQHDMVREVAEDTGGRRAHRYYAIDARNAKSQQGPPTTPPTASPSGVNGVNGVPANGNEDVREVLDL